MDSSSINIRIIPLYEDNLCYYLFSENNPKQGIFIDVGDESIVTYCEEKGIEPLAILTTHKHWDHSNGNKAMRTKFPNLHVYGGEFDNVPGCTHPVKDGDSIQIDNFVFHCFHVPCHTKGHILYHFDTGIQTEFEKVLDSEGVLIKNIDNGLFTGDTLFIGGCGRFFEGDAT